MIVAPTEAERQRVRERPRELAIMRQVWRHLGFLHWPVDAGRVAPLLPPRLDVDTFDGVAYVGVVPFTVPSTRALGLLPIAPAFHELNLRTYVHRGGRDPGVWFFSLDATSTLAVAGARIGFGLPYFGAQIFMEAKETAAGATTIAYRSLRKGAPGARGPASFQARYRPDGEARLAQPGTLEHFLIERYLLYAWNGHALRTGRVFHRPYPVQPAVAEAVQETLLRAAGLPEAPAGPPPLVHYAREVDVRIFRPHRAA